MKKFNRLFKRLLKKIKRLVDTNEYELILKYFIYLLKKNKEIKENKIDSKYLERTPAKRGEIFVVDFGYNIGTEFRGKHYCVVLKVEGNMVIALPLTSKNNEKESCINLGIIKKLNNKEKIVSYALLNQIRAISRARLIRPAHSGKVQFVKLNNHQLNLIDGELEKYLLFKKNF